MNINLNLYKYFYSVASKLSFTKAADELMISQPSLSYSVKILEEQLNKKLFERTVKGIQLTTDGKNLFDKLTPIINGLDSIFCEDIGMNGKIVVGVRTYYSQYILPNKIQLINLIYPELKVEFKIGNSDRLHEYLKNNEVDFIVDEYKECDDSYICETLKSENSPVVFFTNSKRNITKVDEEILNDEMILNVEENRYLKEILDKNPSIRTENIYSTPAMIEEAKYKNRIGISALFLINTYVKSGDIKILDTDINLGYPNFALHAIYNKNNKSSKITNIISVFKDYNYEETINALKEQ